MNIAVIGTGNVGGALAQGFIKAGHTVWVGANFPLSEKSINLATKIGEDRFTTVSSAVAQCNVVVLAIPAMKAIEVTHELGDTSGKVIIDAMNTVRGMGPAGFSHTTEAILANTATNDVVKCFNTTGFENLLDPIYKGEGIDMFVAGTSVKAKAIATQLAKEIGFGECYDLGGNDKFGLLEQLALNWITLAIFQGYGRGIAFKVVKR
ncbi:NADPH-dependent F420 reductase [Spirosoma sp. HMF3257]|uniref:NADPH-dependent F420 reductase n=1 Tax=Spirosoma telluris TaxID=2183553 RepID=A0A327NEE6_9BACT|nr:NADPH-dependent F420 reductase [Spirosoma telluris]RAI73487.1 NADPH-dependent F420 reductase [Spirosoma telluris]